MNATITVTPRQREVILGIAQGKSNDEVARDLGLSSRTVKAHCDALRAKLRVAKRRDLPGAYQAQTGDDPYPRVAA